MRKRAVLLIVIWLLPLCAGGCDVFSIRKFVPPRDAADAANGGVGVETKVSATAISDTRVDKIFGWLGHELLVSGSIGDDGAEISALFRYRYTDSGLEIMKALGEKDILDAFPSPDGRKALISDGIYSKSKPGIDYQDYIYDLRSDGTNQIAQKSIDGCGWSCDSRYLAYYSGPSASFYLYDTVECSTRKVRLPAKYGSDRVKKPAVSEDGETVYFLYDPDGSGDAAELFAADFSGGVRAIADGLRDYAIINGGKSVLYLYGAGKHQDELHMLDIGGVADRKISGDVASFSVSDRGDMVACCREDVIYISAIKGNVIEEGSKIYTLEGLGGRRPRICWGMNGSALLVGWSDSLNISHNFIIEII